MTNPGHPDFQFFTAGANGGENVTVLPGFVGGTSWAWHMDAGHMVFTSFGRIFGSGGAGCDVVSRPDYNPGTYYPAGESTPIPHFAQAGVSGQAMRCYHHVNAGGIRTLGYESLRWDVRTSKLPGQVLVCLTSQPLEAMHYGCVRGDQSGSVDATKLPWESE